MNNELNIFGVKFRNISSLLLRPDLETNVIL